ncbi:MAG: DUF1614 domain-containing protein [Candidatus Thermoplasmatota archaeon]|nr:DUF1614 domain-containing protein [Candidatus Thermoplasmatota archaeon]
MRPRLPAGLFTLVLVLPLLVVLVVMIFVGAINQAFQALGFPPWTALLLLLGVLGGSFVNIPVWTVSGRRERYAVDAHFPFRGVREIEEGSTTIHVNLGGAVIPVVMSVYLLTRLPWALFPHLLFATAFIALVCYQLARPVRGVGIAMPALVPPLLASLTALILVPQRAMIIAFVSGVLGVLLGADLLHLPQLRKVGAPAASIGGAGTFDGIFLTGVLSVLLVAMV